MRQRGNEKKSDKKAVEIKIKNYDEDLQHLVEPPNIDDETATKIVNDIASQDEEIYSYSTTTTTAKLPKPMSLTWNDVTIQRIMGVGGSAVVTLTRVPKLDAQEQCVRWYALKCINKDIMTSSDTKRIARAAKSMYREANILSSIRHRNIVQIHGVVKGAPQPSTFQQPGGYFMVLQCMQRTLDEQLRCWGKDSTKAPKLSDRISNFAIGIASALGYLHEKRILYRDLKPHNIGVDYNGTVRIFDFGMAVKMDDDQVSVPGCVGSLRYMAPEVLIQHRSSFASDVYAFGMLLWYLVTLKKPFGDDEMNTYLQYRKTVGENRERPENVDETIDEDLSWLIQESWQQNPIDRLTIAEIIKRLRQWHIGQCPNPSTSTATIPASSSSSTAELHQHEKKRKIFKPKKFFANTILRRKRQRRIMQSV